MAEIRTSRTDSGECIASLFAEAPGSSDRLWTIGELARECDVTLRAMRFYEAKGLPEPSREGLARLYDAENRRRLRIIVRAKKLGFSLVQIRDLLGLVGSAEPLDRRLGVVGDRLRQQIGQLEAMRIEAEQALVAIADEIAALDRALAPDARG